MQKYRCVLLAAAVRPAEIRKPKRGADSDLEMSIPDPNAHGNVYRCRGIVWGSLDRLRTPQKLPVCVHSSACSSPTPASPATRRSYLGPRGRISVRATCPLPSNADLGK